MEDTPVMRVTRSSLCDLYVRDKATGRVHRIGSDKHDGLWVDEEGTVHYENLQNGDGCGAESRQDPLAGYEFVPSDFGTPDGELDEEEDCYEDPCEDCPQQCEIPCWKVDHGLLVQKREKTEEDRHAGK